MRESLKTQSPATKILVILNVAIFFFQWSLGPLADAWLIASFGLSRDGLSAGHYWQLLTHIFLHGNLLHLIVNMFALWFAGSAVESWIGSTKLVLIFLIGGICGGLLQVLLFPEGSLIGASGGVCSVLLTFTTLEPNLPITAFIFFVLPLQIKSKYLGYGILLISILLPILGLDPHVGHFAHLGGALFGFFYATYLRKFSSYSPFSPPLTPKKNPLQKAFDATWSPTPESRKINLILDKVLRFGFQSLSPEERKILEQWSRSQKN
ncbi:MAG: rhomboid family intramembrane serine protease [Chthoniobacterales bacterium]|nr:rhomboid family intramembrane serine protease [Chthoniobacterales bacterium]